MATAYPVRISQLCEVIIAGRATGLAADVKPVVNVLHYGNVSFPFAPVATLPELLAALQIALRPAWKTSFPNQYVVSAVSVRLVEDPTTGALLDPTPDAWNGVAGTGDFQPTDSAVFIQKVNAWRFKGAIPGVHISPVLESWTDDFRVNATGAPFYAALAAALQTPLTIGGIAAWQPVVYSKLRSPLDPMTGFITTNGAPTTAFRVRKTLGTMRRRKVRGVY